LPLVTCHLFIDSGGLLASLLACYASVNFCTSWHEYGPDASSRAHSGMSRGRPYNRYQHGSAETHSSISHWMIQCGRSCSSNHIQQNRRSLESFLEQSSTTDQHPDLWSSQNECRDRSNHCSNCALIGPQDDYLDCAANKIRRTAEWLFQNKNQTFIH
jgi:hypothetical protein